MIPLPFSTSSRLLGGLPCGNETVVAHAFTAYRIPHSVNRLGTKFLALLWFALGVPLGMPWNQCGKDSTSCCAR